MTAADAFRLSEHIRVAVDELAEFAAGLTYASLPARVRERLPVMLTDLFGVTIAGARTPEFTALTDAWHCAAGDAVVPGADVRTVPETAAYLSAVAACMLELDEGNKYAAGHPAAHVVFAAVAASHLGGPVDGQRFLTAVAAGYEVAARFGRATRRDPRWHPHGHWGATGAACAAALMLGGDQSQVAAAVDASTGLMHVTPWETVLTGDFTRNLWIGGANLAGLNAARLALSGLVTNQGSAAHTFGSIMGSVDAELLTAGLGSDWLTTKGYVKQHSSCSYTHAAIDLVTALAGSGCWARAEDIEAVRVRIHSLAEPLLRRHPRNRLAAMFSLPFVVATAAVAGRVDPDVMDPDSPVFAAAEAFSSRVSVELDPELDAYLPHLRCASVEMVLHDGTSFALAQSNPVGDVAHLPLSAEEVRAKLARLIGADDASQVVEAVAGLSAARSVTAALDRLP